MKKGFFLIIVGVVLLGCGIASPMRWNIRSILGSPWEVGSFASEGERIYFTATDGRGKPIPYEGGPVYGGMMMQGRLACASCHGSDGRGGRHTMHMQVMDAPDIRFATINSEEGENGVSEGGLEHTQGEYNIDTFRQAVVDGKHPDGENLSKDMPRWEIGDKDLAAILEYLKTLP